MSVRPPSDRHLQQGTQEDIRGSALHGAVSLEQLESGQPQQVDGAAMCSKTPLKRVAERDNRDQDTRVGKQRTGHLGPWTQPKWTADPVWQRHKNSLVSFPSGFSVLELCAGAGTAALALKLLLGNEDHLAGAWDTDGNLKAIYDVVHGEHPEVHFGVDGDILKTPLKRFPSANAVVCGPPCQPYSTYGKRATMGDPRAEPFHRCIDVIAELDSRASEQSGPRAGHPKLMFVVFENTLGILQKKEGQPLAPLATFKRILSERLGKRWSFHAMKVTSSDYGLPQSRTRVYLVGRNGEFYGGGTGMPTGPPQALMYRLDSRSLLDTEDNQQEHYTPLQENALTSWKHELRSAMEDVGNQGKFVFVEVGRDPTSRTAWSGTTPKLDICECLRASGPQLHVFSLGDGVEDTHILVNRGLRIHERAALQGFPSEIGHLRFTENIGRRIFGNAMSVPVIGSVLAQELQAILSESARRRIQLDSFFRVDLCAEPSLRYVPRTPPATHRFGWDSLNSCFKVVARAPTRPQEHPRLSEPSAVSPEEPANRGATAATGAGGQPAETGAMDIVSHEEGPQLADAGGQPSESRQASSERQPDGTHDQGCFSQATAATACQSASEDTQEVGGNAMCNLEMGGSIELCSPDLWFQAPIEVDRAAPRVDTHEEPLDDEDFAIEFPWTPDNRDAANRPLEQPVALAQATPEPALADALVEDFPIEFTM